MKRIFNLTISITFLLFLTIFGISVFLFSSFDNKILEYESFLNSNETKNDYEFMGDGIIQVVSGPTTSYALVDGDGDISNGGEEIWAWGENSQGQVGTGSMQEFYEVPTLIYLDTILGLDNGSKNHILSIDSNNGTTFAVVDTDSNASNGGEEIWGWGKNNNGNLGIEFDNSFYRSPQKTKTDEMLENEYGGENHIISVSTGITIQSALIDTDGDISNGGEEVWSWGINDKGQIGAFDEASLHGEKYLPTQTKTDEMLINEEGGENHILTIEDGNKEVMTVVDTDGNASNGGEELWAWGSSENYQISSNPSSIYPTPWPISFGDDNNDMIGNHILQLSNNSTHSMVLIDTDNNPSNGGEEIWSWGRNEKGQLGSGGENSSYSIDSYASVQDSWNVSGNEKILSIEVGKNSSIAIIDTDNNIYNGGEEAWTWGLNDVGQLGNGTSLVQENVASSNVPVKVSDEEYLSNNVGMENHIVGCSVGGSNDFLVLDSDGNKNNGGEEIWAWGSDEYGSLGDEDDHSPENNSLVPIKTLSLTDFFVKTDSFQSEPTSPTTASFTINVFSGDETSIDTATETQFTSFDPTKLTLKSNGDNLGTTTFVSENKIDDLESIYTYSVSGLESNKPYNKLSLIYDDGVEPIKEFIINENSTIQSDLTPIQIESSSFRTQNATPESIEFTIEVTSGDESQHYEFFNPEELKIEYNGEFSFGETEWISGKYSGTGDQTNTYTYKINGLSPNKTYDNLKIKYQDQTVQLHSNIQTIARKPQVISDTFNVLNVAFHDMYFEIDVLSGDGTGEYYSFDPEKLIFKSNGLELDSQFVNSQRSNNDSTETYEYHVDNLEMGKVYDNLSFVYEGEEILLGEEINFETLNPYDNISMDFTTIDNIEISYTSIGFTIKILYTNKLPYDIQTQTKMEFYSDNSVEPKGEVILEDFESFPIPDPSFSKISEDEIEWFEATVTYSIQSLNPGEQFEDMRLEMWSLDNYGDKNEIIGQTALPSSYWTSTNPLVYIPEDSSSFETFDVLKDSFKLKITINQYDGTDFDFEFDPETDVKLTSDGEELETNLIDNDGNTYTYEVVNLSSATTYRNFVVSIHYHYIDNSSLQEDDVINEYSFNNVTIITPRNIFVILVMLIIILLLTLFILAIYGIFEKRKLKMKVIYKTPDSAIIVLNKTNTGLEYKITELSLVDRSNHLIPYSIISLGYDGVTSYRTHSGEEIDFIKYQNKMVILIHGTLGTKYKNLYLLDQNYKVDKKLYGKLKF